MWNNKITINLVIESRERELSQSWMVDGRLALAENRER